MKVYVLLRASKKTGKVDYCMTGITSGLMKMWAMNNTTKSKLTLIIERDTGIVAAAYTGRADNLPKIEKIAAGTLCTEYGISIEALNEIKDDRFDK